MKHEIIGDDMQAVRFLLEDTNIVTAEAGMMTYMTKGIQMETTTNGGIWKGVKRMLTGESFFVTKFSGPGEVCFSGTYPGKILPIKMNNETIMAQRDAYLCSSGDIDISIGFTKRLGAGFFGGEGFILQKLSGKGEAFLHAGGFIVEKELKKGEIIRIDTGCLVAFESTIDYDIQFTGGVKTALFGGEGLFLATLEGPGKVWIQTLPLSRLAQKIGSKFQYKGEKRRFDSSILGNVVNGI
ncbi:MAG: TIGR00266 family protein [Nanoarchaeota archaeon]